MPQSFHEVQPAICDGYHDGEPGFIHLTISNDAFACIISRMSNRQVCVGNRDDSNLWLIIEIQ